MRALRWFLLLIGLLFLGHGRAAAQQTPLVGTLTYQRTWSGEATDDERNAGNYTITYTGSLKVSVDQIVLMPNDSPSPDGQGHTVQHFLAIAQSAAPAGAKPPSPISSGVTLEGDEVDKWVATQRKDINISGGYCDQTPYHAHWSTAPPVSPDPNTPDYHGGLATVTLDAAGMGSVDFHWTEPSIYSNESIDCYGKIRNHQESREPVDMPGNPVHRSLAHGTAQRDADGVLTIQIRYADTVIIQGGVSDSETLTVDLVQQPPGVDLEIDGVPSNEKQTVGGLVVRHVVDADGDNLAPRLKLTLQVQGGTSKQEKVALDNPGEKVKIYLQPAGGQALTFDGKDNVFLIAGTDPPKELWVEGAEASEQMRDVEITARLVETQVAQAGAGPPPPSVTVRRKDDGRFTIPWADQPTLQWHREDLISPDNDGRSAWLANELGSGERVDDHLGPKPSSIPTVVRGMTSRGAEVGWVVEGKATVHPSDFSYPNRFPDADLPSGKFPIKPVLLDRDASHWQWHNDGSGFSKIDDPSSAPSPNWVPGIFSAPGFIPPHHGNDVIVPTDPGRVNLGFFDTTPPPNGAIYNLDRPGFFFAVPKPYQLVTRVRSSFQIFADVEVKPHEWVRCSPFYNYSIVQSWVQVDKPAGTNWQMLTKDNLPPGITLVAGDNTVYENTTEWFNKTTWDLKATSESGF